MPTEYEYTDSIYDAYVASDGTMAVIETRDIGSSYPTRDYLEFVNIEMEYIDEWDSFFYKEGEQYRYNPYIAETGGIACSIDVNNSTYEMNNVSVIDIDKGEIAMSAIGNDRNNYVKLLYIEDDVMFWSEYDQLVFMDRYTRDKHHRIKVDGIEEDMWLDYLFKCDEGFAAIVKQEKKKDEWLYYINTDTDETTELMKLNDRVLIDVREDKVTFAKGNGIICSEITDGKLGDTV